MKITIEFESLAELDAFRGAAATPAPAAEPDAEPELTPAQKAARTRAANKAKKKAEAEQQAAEPEPQAEPVAQEPEPEPEPQEPATAPKLRLTGESSVVTMAQPEPEPEPGIVPEVEAVAEKFRSLVSRDYDKAASLLNELGCETFSEVAEQNKLGELAAALG